MQPLASIPAKKKKVPKKTIQIPATAELDAGTDSDDSGQNEKMTLSPRRLLEMMAHQEQLQSPRGVTLSPVASRMIKQLQEPTRSKFIRLCEKNPNATSVKSDVLDLVQVTKQHQIVEQNMIATRNLTPSMVEDGLVKKEFWQSNLWTATQDSVLADELINRMSGPGLAANLEARRLSIIGENLIKHEYSSLSSLLILMADEMEPSLFLSLKTSERIVRRLVLMEDAALTRSKDSKVSISDTMSKHDSFVGNSTGISASARKLLGR